MCAGDAENREDFALVEWEGLRRVTCGNCGVKMTNSGAVAGWRCSARESSSANDPPPTRGCSASPGAWTRLVAIQQPSLVRAVSTSVRPGGLCILTR